MHAILITGSHRSGSTWIGRMLALSPKVGYIPEPFGLHHRPGLLASPFQWWFPSDWLFVRHEDVSREPVEQFRRIFDWFGLPFGRDIEVHVQEYSSDTNPVESIDHLEVRRSSRENIRKWRQILSEDEIQRIRRAVEPLSQAFYTDMDWDRAESGNVCV